MSCILQKTHAFTTHMAFIVYIMLKSLEHLVFSQRFHSCAPDIGSIAVKEDLSLDVRIWSYFACFSQRNLLTCSMTIQKNKKCRRLPPVMNSMVARRQERRNLSPQTLKNCLKCPLYLKRNSHHRLNRHCPQHQTRLQLPFLALKVPSKVVQTANSFNIK